jgi:hypothetical protein
MKLCESNIVVAKMPGGDEGLQRSPVLATVALFEVRWRCWGAYSVPAPTFADNSAHVQLGESRSCSPPAYPMRLFHRMRPEDQQVWGEFHPVVQTLCQLSGPHRRGG